MEFSLISFVISGKLQKKCSLHWLFHLSRARLSWGLDRGLSPPLQGLSVHCSSCSPSISQTLSDTGHHLPTCDSRSSAVSFNQNKLRYDLSSNSICMSYPTTRGTSELNLYHFVSHVGQYLVTLSSQLIVADWLMGKGFMTGCVPWEMLNLVVSSEAVACSPE